MISSSVLAPLGRRVGNDRDRPGGADAVEIARTGGDALQRLLERAVREIDRERLIPELRIEDHVDRREVPDGRQDVACRRAAEDERVGELHRAWNVEAERRQILRLLDEALQPGAPLGPYEHLRPQLGAQLAHLPFDVAAGRVQFERDLELDERFLELARAGEAPGSGVVLLRRAELHPLEGLSKLVVVRALAQRVLVLDHRAIVVLGALGFARRPRRRVCGARRHDGRPGQCHDTGQRSDAAGRSSCLSSE